MLGGGEKGCRRTREILCNAGYNVITVDKATMSHGAVSYVKSAIFAILKMKKQLHENPNAILYVVGFYEKNLPLEWILINAGGKREKQYMKLAMADWLRHIRKMEIYIRNYWIAF
mgnify:CR=1 FL=1